MSVKGTSRANQLTLAKFSIDRMQGGIPAITALAALTNSDSGTTHGYVDAKGVQWSKDTRKALEALMLSVEKDLAETHLTDVGVSSPTSEQPSMGAFAPEGGLEEFLDDGTGTQSV